MNKNPKMHYGHYDRVRKKVINTNPYDLDDTLILETFLQFVFIRADTNEIAKNLLAKYGSVVNMLQNALPKDLEKINGMGKNSADKLCALFRAINSIRLKPMQNLITSETKNYSDMVDMLYKQFEGITYERFLMFVLNDKNQITYTKVISEGDVNHVIINKKYVIELAKTHNAKSIVLAHNHPTGGMYPSIEDVRVTADIYRLLLFEGIQLLDHIIVAPEGLFSFTASHVMRAIDTRIRNMYR